MVTRVWLAINWEDCAIVLDRDGKESYKNNVYLRCLPRGLWRRGFSQPCQVLRGRRLNQQCKVSCWSAEGLTFKVGRSLHVPLWKQNHLSYWIMGLPCMHVTAYLCWPNVFILLPYRSLMDLPCFRIHVDTTNNNNCNNYNIDNEKKILT